MLELNALVLKAGSPPFSHRFEAGQINVVLGRNHSGKTRLARVIAGLDAPESGEVLLGGKVVTGDPPGKRSVALVYQDFVNYPNWTVFENLASPQKAQRVSAALIRERVLEIAGQMQLTEFLDRYPDALSGGQQQRLAIGRAMAKSADVLVMDEPLVNLDYKLREALQVELRGLLREFGVSVVYTTSDPRDAFALGDTLLLLADHRLLQAGPPLSLYESPGSPAAADLMSDPCANRWMVGGDLRLIRPEHLSLDPAHIDDVAFPVQVLGRETNGSETFVHCQADVAEANTQWVAKLSGLVDLAPGSREIFYASATAI
ncbi:MAG: ABC transporter ATP-binding protein, partial [Pseudomonadales bacterium]